MPKTSVDIFEELFALYYPRLKNYANSLLKNQDEANDVVQDVFFQLWENQQSLDSGQNISSFVFTILRNKCLNILKRRIVEEKYLHHQAHFPSEELYHISFEKSGEFVSLEELLHNELLRLIEKMPEKCGMAFRLKWIEGKKNREIAEEMNISTSMVDKHLAKGLVFARENLNPNLFLFFVWFSKTTIPSC